MEIFNTLNMILPSVGSILLIKLIVDIAVIKNEIKHIQKELSNHITDTDKKIDSIKTEVTEVNKKVDQVLSHQK